MTKMRERVKTLLPSRAFELIEPTGHLLEAVAIANINGRPARKMHVIGVTGTNGKTTTSFMIHSILVEAGLKTALMTTVGYGINRDIASQIEHMTSVSPAVLQRRLKAFTKAGAQWLVMEVTSHALAQNRDWGVPYDIAVLTNLTHEHLDYHKTFERYLEAKLKLFKKVARRGLRLGIINADDPSASHFQAVVPNSMMYGLDKGTVKPTNLKLRADGSSYDVKIDTTTYHIDCHIAGAFNVANSLAAVCVAHALGLPKAVIERGIASLQSVEGRMNSVDVGQAYTAIVDFAHTPDAFERLLKDIRSTTTGKLVVVFGSAGRRDEAKREKQGEIAGFYGDELILTEEDDRDVDGHTILEQIAVGARRSGKKDDKDLFKVLDRGVAINFAVNRVKAANDTVIFLGKGHEKTIERADGPHPWDETETVKAAIRASMKRSE